MWLKKCNKTKVQNQPCQLINKSEKVFCNVPWIAKNSVGNLEKNPYLAFFFLDWRVFCKSYSLTFVNLLLQKLAGSKFSHISHPWLMYSRHMNNYTKKVPLLNCITKKVLGHIFQYHSRFRKGQGCHSDWKYPKSLSILMLLNWYW